MSEDRATYSVNIATFKGRRLCDIKRRLRHIAVTLRHLLVGATFSSYTTYSGATHTKRPYVKLLSFTRSFIFIFYNLPVKMETSGLEGGGAVYAEARFCPFAPDATDIFFFLLTSFFFKKSEEWGLVIEKLNVL